LEGANHNVKNFDLIKHGLDRFKRRSVAFAATLCLASTLAFPAAAQTGTPPIQAFDEFMTNLLQDYSIPGGAIAVTQNGHLLMAKGYGLADKANAIPVHPDSLFRIASLSKLVTSVTVMHLVDQGKVTLDQPAFALLPDLQAPAGTTEDPRLASITIANLLDHSGGWDNDKIGYDPMVHGVAIAAAMGVPTPASTENTIRYMRGQPLNFDPGTQYSYSNFGYAVLGRIIERVTGMSYEQYVRTNVLAPMGITDMRIGQTLAEGQLPGEVKYYSPGQTSANISPAQSPKSYPCPTGPGVWKRERRPLGRTLVRHCLGVHRRDDVIRVGVEIHLRIPDVGRFRASRIQLVEQCGIDIGLRGGDIALRGNLPQRA
jgi:CubicO group peptidase (beta-lactamase class C family)